MAYTLKYRSNFYNIYGKYIEVEISKADYTGAVTDLRNTEVYIEVNYQDNNTPVIGTGCSIVIINQGAVAGIIEEGITVDDDVITVDDDVITVDVDTSSCEDLLTSTEKQFKCVVKYGGVTVFQGFSICDLNEQQFLPWSRIKVQFTDYLRRLEGHFAANFFIGANTDLLTILKYLITEVGFLSAYELYVNSTLMETQMVSDGGLTKTFLPQTYVENNMYFSNTNTYDDVYKCVNKVFNSIGAFIYSCGDKWILERHEDVLRDKNTSSWVKYDYFNTATNTPSLKEEYNKQAGDFNYVDESQILTYESGLHTLILNLKDKAYDTFVFNDFSVDMQRVSDIHPEPGTLQLKTWYAYEDILLLNANFDYKGIGSYIKWSYPNTLGGSGDFANMGLYYSFEVQFQPSTEDPITLNINYKMSGELDITTIRQVDMRFVLRVDGGDKDGYYLANSLVPPDNAIVALLFSAWSNAVFTITQIDVSTAGEKTWSVNASFNLTDTYSHDGATYTNIWDQLGNPTSQKFMIYFYPTRFYLKQLPPGATDNDFFTYNRVNYLGDVEITITQQKVRNKITYYINEDFVKTEELDIDFWDLDNINYANGLMYGLGGIGNDAIGKTLLWTSELCPEPQELMDIFCKNKFRNYARTIHKLKGRIMHDGYMKPLSVLTDNNKPNVSFILQGYTWDLNNGIYDITAEEYTTEDIVLADEGASGGASSGGGGGDPGILPPAPTGLALDQMAGTSLFINVVWDDAIGATGYILQRQPYHTGFSWADSWKTIFEGDPGMAGNTIDDYILLEGSVADGTIISYRVASKTTLFYGAYSSVVTITWYN